MQLYFSSGLILAIVLWGIAAPNSLGAVFDMLLAVITRDFGWLYLWVVLGMVVLAMVLAFSRYGDLKLGAEDHDDDDQKNNQMRSRKAHGSLLGCCSILGSCCCRPVTGCLEIPTPVSRAPKGAGHP